MATYGLGREWRSTLKVITFKKLPIGETFEFESVLKYPYSGMARGPWKKTSARRYTDGTHTHEVGSVNAKVILGNPMGVSLGGKRRHGKEPEWYELQGKWVLELGKKGFAHVWPDKEKLGYGGWRARVYDAEGNLIHEGIPQGGVKHAKEWARMFMDVPAGKGLTIAIHARHSQRWGGGKRRHGGIDKQADELRKLLK
jgi:hypothetical protein